MNPWNVIGWILLFIGGVVAFFVFGMIFAATGNAFFHPVLWALGIGGIVLWKRRKRNPRESDRKYMNRPNGAGIYDRERDW